MAAGSAHRLRDAYRQALVPRLLVSRSAGRGRVDDHPDEVRAFLCAKPNQFGDESRRLFCLFCSPQLNVQIEHGGDIVVEREPTSQPLSQASRHFRSARENTHHDQPYRPGIYLKFGSSKANSIPLPFWTAPHHSTTPQAASASGYGTITSRPRYGGGCVSRRATSSPTRT